VGPVLNHRAMANEKPARLMRDLGQIVSEHHKIMTTCSNEGCPNEVEVLATESQFQGLRAWDKGLFYFYCSVHRN
jgi:hypothetical protein